MKFSVIISGSQILLVSLTVLLIMSSANALPCKWWGSVYLDGQPVNSNVVEVYNANTNELLAVGNSGPPLGSYYTIVDAEGVEIIFKVSGFNSNQGIQVNCDGDSINLNLTADSTAITSTTTTTLPSPPSGGGGGGGGGGASYVGRPKKSCFDGIKNCHHGSCEEGIDCGGPCLPCPSCFDGIQNQGEEGIDCGGPCEPCVTTTTSTTTVLTTTSIQTTLETTSTLSEGETTTLEETTTVETPIAGRAIGTTPVGNLLVGIVVLIVIIIAIFMVKGRKKSE